MYGQMTAGSWIYIGAQGIVQGTYETFAEAGSPALRRRSRRALDPYGGLGWHGRRPAPGCHLRGRGEPQHRVPAVQHRLPPAHAVSGPAGSEPGPRHERIKHHTAKKEAVSIALLGNAAELLPELATRADRGPEARPRHRPDLGPRPHQRLSSQSAGPSSSGRPPAGRQQARGLKDAAGKPAPCMSRPCRISEDGHPVVDYGNNIRQVADNGVANAFDFPGFVPAYIRPFFCEGKGPFRWVALSGDPEDIYKTDAKIKELFPTINRCIAGWTWRGSGSRFRACLRAFAGSAWASGTCRAGFQRDG